MDKTKCLRRQEDAMRKIVSVIAASLFVLLHTVVPLLAQNPQRQQDQTKWIADSLIEMKTIKVGMTRSDLLKVFDTEGGLSTGLNRTYVYRKCPLIKVDVEFQPIG